MISIRKISALFTKTMKVIANNPFILVGVLVTPLIAFVLSQTMDDDAIYILPMFVMLNTMSGGATVMSCLIAEEKEKNTLNVLITSTVSTLDFLISKLLVALLFTLAINIFLYFFLDAATITGLGIFIAVTSLSALGGALIGAIIGLISKTQTSASTTTTPFLILPMLPLFIPDNFFVDNILYYFFTEQTAYIFQNLYDGEFHLFRIGIMVANLAVLAVVFAVLYKKRGLGTA
jgi:ABC-2 type transport system permease protein